MSDRAQQHHSAKENKILAALNLRSEHLFSRLERVELKQEEVIYEADSEIRYVYFPETAIFSMLSTMADGSTVEVGPVGDEGMVGLRVFLGASTSLDRVIVHVSGTARRLSAEALSKELRMEQTTLRKHLLRYTQMLLAMTGQTAACYNLHTLEQNLVRWLLMMHDYIDSDELLLTHELIALTLGVRRAGVTEAALILKNRGVIDYRRGHMHIIDRERLQELACECYQKTKTEYELLYADLA